MADSKIASNLDKKLMEDGIIDPAYMGDYKKVHSLLNTHLRQTGRMLDEENFKKGEEKLRSWLSVLQKKGASQEKLSSYLRCGLAHLSFDFIESTYKYISPDDLITRAYQSFKKRGFHKTFFKVSSAANKKPPKKKTAAGSAVKKKKAPAKKTQKAKPATKKTAGKTGSAGGKKKKASSRKKKTKKGILARIFGR